MKRFRNVPYRRHASFFELIKWAVTREIGPWDRRRNDFAPAPPPPPAVPIGGARVTFVGHASVLIQIDGLNILTDPVYSDRASPVSWAGPRRVRPPGIRFDDLPAIHAVLISHNHYDHLNLETLGRLNERDQPAIITGLRNSELLAANGIRGAKELNWWQREDLDQHVSVTFVPAQHFSGRGLLDRDRTLWGGFYLTGSEHAILFAGDTGEGPHFKEIRDRLGAPDLALIPIGAFRPPNIMQPIHLSPKEAVAAHFQVGARWSMAIHFGTFPLADDGQYEPIELLDEELTARRLTRETFWVLDAGEGRDIAPERTVE